MIKWKNLRTDEAYKSRERQVQQAYNKKSKRTLRESARSAQARKDDSFKSRERQAQKTYNKTTQRKQAQRNKISELRLNQMFLEYQRNRQARWMENAANSRRMKIRRYDRFYRASQNRKSRIYVRRLRKYTRYRTKEMRLQQKSKVIARKQKCMRTRLQKKQMKMKR